MIVYIDDILVFSNNLQKHCEHLKSFHKLIRDNGFVLSAKKLHIFQENIDFLGFSIQQNIITPKNRVIEFGAKFLDEIKDKTQLQRFLGCLNYIADFYKNLAQDRKLLEDRLKKNPKLWTQEHTQAVRRIKRKIKNLPYLVLANNLAQKIVQTDASEIGYGGILLQKVDKKEQLVRFTSGKWNVAQLKYPTIKKEILSIVNCLNKF